MTIKWEDAVKLKMILRTNSLWLS